MTTIKRSYLGQIQLVLLSIIVAACITTKNDEEASAGDSKSGKEGKATSRYYSVLVKGKTVKYAEPLPNMIPFYLKDMKGDEVMEERLVFRSWDFNKDGFPDMVEEMLDHGIVRSRSFDFDFDGLVDDEWQRQ